nr:transposase (putative), gypsy type [Tanacetum cinerariifolium]
MGRDTVRLETAVNTISHEYLLEFTSEYDIPETLHPELPGPKDRIVDSSEGKVGVYTRFFEFANFRFPLPQFLFDVLEMDLFNLICAPNPTKVKTGSRPRAPHELPLLTLTATRVIEMDDLAVATDSSGVPSTIDRSPLDFTHEAGASDQGTAAPEMPPSEDVPATAAPGAGQAEEIAATEPPAARESSKRGRDGTYVNAPPPQNHCEWIMLILDPPGAPMGEKVLLPFNWVWLLMFLYLKMLLQASVTRISYPLLTLRHAIPLMLPSKSSQGIAAAGDPESENVSSLAEVGSSGSVYRPEWSVTNGSLLDTPEACQDLVDHAAPSARQVAMGSQLRLRFEQEAKLLRKSVAQVAPRDKRIQARELKIKNLEALLETEADMKKAAKDKSAGLTQELEDMCARFLDLQVSNEHLSQQVATLQEQVSGEEKLKAAFKEFKRYEDDRVERRCAELDARLDALSIDFDEELYPHMLIAIACRIWVIGHGLRLAVMKCGESLEMRQAFVDVVSARIAKGMSKGLRHGVEQGQAQLNVESIEAYDPEAEAKFVAALQALKDLKYPLLDQLEGLKDAPIDVIMAFLYLESDTGEDAPRYIRDLRPGSSQLTILVYLVVRDPQNPWACKEEMKLADAIAANVSCAEKKKKCRIVCHTHGVGSAHHARSDGVPVSVPTVVPQGLALLLAGAATQTEFEDT